MRPVMAGRRRTFRAHGDRRGQFERRENRIVDVAAHVAERGRAEIDPLAPVARMIVAIEIRPRLRDAQPQVPVERRRHGVGAIGHRLGVAPFLFAPGVDLLHLADGAALDQRGRREVFAAGVDAGCPSA